MLLSVIVPLLNEEDNLEALHARLVATLEKIGCDRRLIFVNDGSTDRSAEILAGLAEKDPTVTVIEFSRNFGHEAASTAGFDEATGDAVVLIDADLQDPPELIAELVESWRAGNEVVYAVRRRREGETFFKKSTSWLFYRMLNFLSEVEIPRDVGDFRLIDHKVVEAVRACRERDRFVRGLIAWAGFRSAAVYYDRDARNAGETKYNPLKLLLLSLDASVGFSILPLRITTGVGFMVMLLALGLAAWVALNKLFLGLAIQGYALATSGMFFMSGTQMLLLGIAGEYIGRTYREAQGRPIYIVRKKVTRGALRSTASTAGDRAGHPAA